MSAPVSPRYALLAAFMHFCIIQQGGLAMRSAKWACKRADRSVHLAHFRAEIKSARILLSLADQMGWAAQVGRDQLAAEENHGWIMDPETVRILAVQTCGQ